MRQSRPGSPRHRARSTAEGVRLPGPSPGLTLACRWRLLSPTVGGYLEKEIFPLLWNTMIFKNMWSAFYWKLFFFFSCHWGLSVSLSYHPAVFKHAYWIMGLISITRSEVGACLNPHVAASGRGQWGVLGGINSKHVFIFQDESQWLQHLHSTTY